MAINFPEGTQNLPAKAVQIVSGSTGQPFSGSAQGYGIISATITPKSSSSGILIIAQCVITVGGTTAGFYIERNGTRVAVGDAAGNRPQLSGKMGGSNSAWNWTPCINFYDTPGTTSSLTYTLRVGAHHTGYTWYVNRNAGDGNSSNWDEGRARTTVTLIEMN